MSIPIEQRTYKDAKLLSKRVTEFESFTVNGILSGNRPKEIFTSKGENNPLTKEIEFLYGPHNQIREYIRRDGASPTTAFLWGYDRTLPVAKIDNATYNEVNAIVAETTIQNDTGDTLLSALDVLRDNLPQAHITTYAYEPLIGVSKMESPDRQEMTYSYDHLNRLEMVKDYEDKVLETYNYNYRLEAMSVDFSVSDYNANLNDNVNFSAIVSGGSGNYTYSWAIIYDNDTRQENVSSLNTASLFMTSVFVPGFKMELTVTDSGTNESVTVVRDIDVDNSLAPLVVNNITIQANAYHVGQNVTYSISHTGGSSSLTYNWTKQSSTTTNLGNSSSSSVTDQILQADCNSFYVTCVVTDTGTGESQTKQVVVNISSGCTNGGNQ